MAGRFEFNEGGNDQRFRAYDQLLQGRKNQSLAEQNQQFEQRFKEAEQQRKSSATEERLKIAQDRLSSSEQAQRSREEDAKALREVAEERMKLREDLANKTQLLKEQHDLTREKATAARVSAGLEFYKGMGRLNPQSPDFQQKYSELMGKVYGNLVDSEGKIPDEIKATSDHLFSQHNAWVASQSNAKSAAIESSVVKGALSFGRLDEKGKLVPNTEGDATGGKATHVSSLYPDPATGRMVSTPPMTIDAFKKIQGSIQPPPPPIVPAATPAATPAPAAGATSATTNAAPDVNDDSGVGTIQPLASESPELSSHTPSQPDWKDPMAVKAAFKAGQLSQDDAAEILRSQFGHQ